MSDVTLERPKHELAVMDSSGDQKTIWDPDNKDEVEAAKATFDALRKKGYTFFYVDKKGDQSGKMKEFDPHAAKMIGVPRIVGG